MRYNPTLTLTLTLTLSLTLTPTLPLRYNRELAAAERAGRDVSTLQPPPTLAVADDRVACPHCNRKFKADVAERHIPKCNARPK